MAISSIHNIRIKRFKEHRAHNFVYWHKQNHRFLMLINGGIAIENLSGSDLEKINPNNAKSLFTAYQKQKAIKQLWTWHFQQEIGF